MGNRCLCTAHLGVRLPPTPPKYCGYSSVVEFLVANEIVVSSNLTIRSKNGLFVYGLLRWPVTPAKRVQVPYRPPLFLGECILSNLFRWYIFLRKLGYSRLKSFDCAIYNSKRWYPEGEWPLKMKKKRGYGIEDVP